MGKHRWEKISICIYTQVAECAEITRPDHPIYPGHFSWFAVRSLEEEVMSLQAQRTGLLIACYETQWILKFSVSLSCNTTYCLCLLYHAHGTGQGGDVPQIRWGLPLTLSLTQESCVFCPHPRNRNRLLACNQISDPRNTLVWNNLSLRSLWSWLYVINQNSRQRNLTYSRNFLLAV